MPNELTMGKNRRFLYALWYRYIRLRGFAILEATPYGFTLRVSLY